MLVLAILANGCAASQSPIEQLLKQASVANPRPVEGRLSVSVHHAPWGGARTAYRHDPLPASDGEDQRVFRGSGPPRLKHELEDLHRIGLLSLYRGAIARAVSALEAVAQQSPSAAVLSDLAAAYLALAQDGRPWLHVDAIAAATLAVERAPEDPSAAFNLALALEHMSLAHESSLAWERYLTVEDDASWRKEVAEHLARLHEPTTAYRWEAEKGRVTSAASAGDWARLADLTRRFPGQIEDLLEVDLLTGWANVAGSPAESVRLATAKRVAESLASVGERLYADAIVAIESRPQGSPSLVDGHRAYAQGLVLRNDCSQAVPVFERALDRLSAGGSPLAWAAQLELLVCAYRHRPLETEEVLSELASELEVLAYPTLLARVEAMRGLCAMAGGRYSQAVAQYERAAELLMSIGETDLTRLHGMLDEAHRFLGDRDTAWRYRLAALGGSVATGNRQIRHAILAGLARELLGEDRLKPARAVLDEMLANADTWSEPGAVAETLLRRIELDLRSGSDAQAAVDIAACAQALQGFQQPADRERLEFELTIASAEYKLTTSPIEALREFSLAEARLKASGYSLLLPRALLGLARAELALDDLEGAEAAFDEALQVYEDRLAGTLREWHRITFFSTAQPSFDAMIRFQALKRGDPHAAFAYSERVRARGLRDYWAASSKATTALGLDRQLDRIPSNVAVIAYTVLPEALLAWQLRQGSLEMHVLTVSRTEVAQLVTSLRAALAGGVPPDNAQAAAARAFDQLLRPALDGVPAETELVFVPDRELFQVPFAALYDQLTGRYLIEDHVCSVAPSLGAFLASRELRTSAAGELRWVLAVGDPAFDDERFPTLPRLPDARAEALAVAALYEDGLLLVGEDATRQRILDGLPGTDILHLAAHVVFDPRTPLLSVVATADTGRAPLRASDLDSERLVGVKLVFLAACDTAPGFANGDREGVAGFARALLAAGVPAVVATLWAVDDQAGARLAPMFHAHILRGESPASALRLAQLTLLSDSSLSAPFAWVPFQLFRGPVAARRKP